MAHVLFCSHQSFKSTSSEEEKAVEEQIMDGCLTFIFFGKAQVHFMETVLSGLTFTLCMDQIETQHGGGEKLSRTALLDTAIYSLGSCIRCFRGYDLALDSNFHAFLGTGHSFHQHKSSIERITESAEIKLGLESKATGTQKVSEEENVRSSQYCQELRDSESEDGERRDYEKVRGKTIPTASSSSSSWLDKGDMPLLARPLLDSLLLIVSLVHPSVMREEEEVVHEKLEDILQFQRSRVMGYSAAGQKSLRSELADEMGCATRMQDRGSHGERTSTVSHLQDQLFSYSEIPGAAGAAIRWLCIGNLLQLLVAEMAPTEIPMGEGEDVRGRNTSSSSTSMSASTSAVNLRVGNESEDPCHSLFDSNDTVLSEWSVGRLCNELIDAVDNHIPPHLRKERTKGSAASTMRIGSIITILKQWCTFIRSTHHILTICRPDLLLEICSSTLPSQITKQSVSTYTEMRVFTASSFEIVSYDPLALSIVNIFPCAH